MAQQDFQGLHNLVAPIGARKARKRLGRGESSGHGKTSGRGHKGQNARKSGQVRIGFEGGQVPLARRLPKRGFTNWRFTKDVSAVNVGRIGEKFKEGAVVDAVSLTAAGLISRPQSLIKILGNGDLGVALKFKVNSVSASALEKIKKSGGEVELVKKAA